MRPLAVAIAVVVLAFTASPASAGGEDDFTGVEATSEGRRIEVTVSAGSGGRVSLGYNPLDDCIFLTNLTGAAVIDYAGGRGIQIEVTYPGMENVLDADGNPQSWVFVSCEEALFGTFNWQVWPQGDPVPTEVLDALAESAISAIELAVPTPETAPDGVIVPFLTQLPVWLWVPEATWVPATARAELVELGVWAQATATPVSTRWESDGTEPVDCGRGVRWTAELRDAESDCLLVYTATTPPESSVDLSVATTFSITVQCSFTCPPNLSLAPVTVVATRPVTVTEARGVIVG